MTLPIMKHVRGNVGRRRNHSSSSSSSRSTSSSRSSACSLLCVVSVVSVVLLTGMAALHFTVQQEHFLQQQQQQQQHNPTLSLAEYTGISSTTTTGSLKRRQRTFPATSATATATAANDGTFNGLPLTLKHEPPGTSHIHCVGENFQNPHHDSWKQRSCQFVNICFDTTLKQFVLFPADQEFAQKFVDARPHFHPSTIIARNLSVGLGGINMKWGHTGIPRIRWFPLTNRTPPASYYALPPQTVMIPFHSMNGANPGHLVWDDFLPIWTLLDMFQLLPATTTTTTTTTNSKSQYEYSLLPIRYKLTNGPRGLWASCDLRDTKTAACNHMIQKFWALLVGKTAAVEFSTTQDVHFQPKQKDVSSLVCAQTGVAGISSLTDHGVSKMHGWEPEDYKFTHNHGRGGALYDFRNFMLRNMGYSEQQLVSSSATRSKPKIVFSIKSSEIKLRSLEFTEQIAALQKHLPAVSVEAYMFRNYTLQEQLDMVVDASIFVTVCGGAAVSAMFLPAKSTVFLYYSEEGGAKNNKMTHLPAQLDWDLFNAMSHLRVHWLPRGTINTGLDTELLVTLAKQELAIIESQMFS